MHPFLAAALVSLASIAAASVEMHSFSLFTRSGLDKRAVCTVEEITPESCEQCYGAGSVNCLSNTCYNPGAGDSCCSDGMYCPAGNYCTDAGCCPNGSTLEQCGATVSLSVVPPPAPAATSPASSASSTLVSQIESTAITSATSSAVVTQISDGQPQAPTGAPVTQISDGQPQAGTATTSLPAVFTGAAATNNGKSGLALGAVIAAVAML